MPDSAMIAAALELIADGRRVLFPASWTLLAVVGVLALAAATAAMVPIVVRHRARARTRTPSSAKGVGMSAIPSERAEILSKRAFGHIATIGPNGEPQVNPVWIDYDGEFLMFSQTTQRQKYHNLKRDSRVAVSMLDPDEPYRYLEIRGGVERFDDDPDYAFINKMAKKYMDLDEYPYLQPGEHRVVVLVRPEHSTMQ